VAAVGFLNHFSGQNPKSVDGFLLDVHLFSPCAASPRLKDRARLLFVVVIITYPQADCSPNFAKLLQIAFVRYKINHCGSAARRTSRPRFVYYDAVDTAMKGK
jgi:hypothetical protein